MNKYIVETADIYGTGGGFSIVIGKLSDGTLFMWNNLPESLVLYDKSADTEELMNKFIDSNFDDLDVFRQLDLHKLVEYCVDQTDYDYEVYKDIESQLEQRFGLI